MGLRFRLGFATTGGAHSFSRSQVNADLRPASALLLPPVVGVFGRGAGVKADDHGDLFYLSLS